MAAVRMEAYQQDLRDCITSEGPLRSGAEGEEGEGTLPRVEYLGNAEDGDS